jgi:hypothetical protein
MLSDGTMNQQDRSFLGAPEAQLRYAHGEFKVVRNGTFVRCAVTGQAILLDDLKYWSVDLQEAYISPEAVLKRLREVKASTVFGR